MAREAHFAALDQVARVVHAQGDGLLVRPASFRVAAEPCGRGTVAILAAYAITQIKSMRSLRRGDIERMTREALRRRLGFAHIQNGGHPFTHSSGERDKCFGVLIADDPNAVFILADAIIGARRDTPVATC